MSILKFATINETNVAVHYTESDLGEGEVKVINAPPGPALAGALVATGLSGLKIFGGENQVELPDGSRTAGHPEDRAVFNLREALREYSGAVIPQPSVPKQQIADSAAGQE